MDDAGPFTHEETWRRLGEMANQLRECQAALERLAHVVRLAPIRVDGRSGAASMPHEHWQSIEQAEIESRAVLDPGERPR